MTVVNDHKFNPSINELWRQPTHRTNTKPTLNLHYHPSVVMADSEIRPLPKEERDPRSAVAVSIATRSRLEAHSLLRRLSSDRSWSREPDAHRPTRREPWYFANLVPFEALLHPETRPPRYAFLGADSAELAGAHLVGCQLSTIPLTL